MSTPEPVPPADDASMNYEQCCYLGHLRPDLAHEHLDVVLQQCLGLPPVLVAADATGGNDPGAVG